MLINRKTEHCGLDGSPLALGQGQGGEGFGVPGGGGHGRFRGVNLRESYHGKGGGGDPPPGMSATHDNPAEAPCLLDLLGGGISPGSPDGHLLGGEHIGAVQSMGGDAFGGLSGEHRPEGRARHIQLKLGIDAGDPYGFDCQSLKVEHWSGV